MSGTLQAEGHAKTDLGATGAEPTVASVLVLDSRPRVRRYADLLVTAGHLKVSCVDTMADALFSLVTEDWDLLLVEPALASVRGRSLIRHAKAVLPDIVVASFEMADVRPWSTDELGVVHIDFDGSGFDVLLRTMRLVDSAQVRQQPQTESVLAIGAHLGDVELGVGGILLAHRRAGHRVAILALSHGQPGVDAALRQQEAAAAADVIGAQLFLDDLDDGHIPVGRGTVELIKRVIDEIRPTAVYTHSINDSHPDHQAVHLATMAAAQPITRIACFQSPTATIDFRPNRFLPIEMFLADKQRALAAYTSQSAREELRPDAVSATTRYWSRFAGTAHAEALEVVRDSSAISHDVSRIGPHGVSQRLEHHDAQR